MEKNKKVVANMKMNMTIHDIGDYLKKINPNVKSKDVVICPTSIYIPYFLKQSYEVGIQNTYLYDEGAYTGEVSPKQAASMGVKYTIIGHSERRKYFLEDDLVINKKILEALKYDMKVILCIGETKEEKSLLRTERVLNKQITRALSDINDISNIIIAYEPIWAIGTSVIPTKEEIFKNVEYIKKVIFEKYQRDDIMVLYGGSVNEKNISDLCDIENISGFLVGGASNDADKFLKIIKEVVG